MGPCGKVSAGNNIDQLASFTGVRTIRQKPTNDRNTITFVTGGGSLIWVGSMVAVIGITLTIYIYQTQVTEKDSTIEMIKTLLFPLTGVLFGVLMATLRYEFVIDGNHRRVAQANVFGPIRLSTKTTDRTAFRAVELQRIIHDPSSPEWDWFSVQLRPIDDELPIGLVSKPADDEVEAFAKRVADMLDLPLEKIETNPREPE